MDNFDKFFENLDDLDNKDKELKKEKENHLLKNCCKNKNNIRIDEKSQTVCNVCRSILNHIVDNPEWRYYGSIDKKIRSNKMWYASKCIIT